jgi:hypothetical protein
MRTDRHQIAREGGDSPHRPFQQTGDFRKQGSVIRGRIESVTCGGACDGDFSKLAQPVRRCVGV